MAGTLPLEIAPSLRLVLVGDSGVGKSQSRSLFLNSVPGQVDAAQPADSLSSPDISALAINDTTEDNTSNGAANGATNGTTNGASNGTSGKANGHGEKYFHKDAVSTLEIPSWLSVSSPIAIDGETAQAMVPAENIVLHDFVGYGQALDARQTIDRVDSFLTEQYVATRGLFGPSITPASTSYQESQPQLGPFLEQLLVDSSMAHSLPDACLYFVLYDLKPVDIIFMKRIMHKVNLIPVLAKADTLTTNRLWQAKSRILKQMQENEIAFFQFGFTIEDLMEMAAEKISGGPPFALSTSELEAQQLGAPAASLTDLANSINQGQFADSHSDLCLLQTLLLGSKNRMLHQASVKKFMNRWRSDLGLPLEEETPAVVAYVQEQSEPADVAALQEHQQELSQEQQQHNTEQQEQQQQEEEEEEGQFYQQEQEQEQQYLQQQQQVEQVQPQPSQQQQQQYTQQQSAQQQPVPQQQTALPPILQPLPYQPSSTYIPYNNQSSLSPKPTQDEEVAQVYKLNRAQSVIRSASPSAKIFTHGGIVPALPTATYNGPSSATSPNSMSPNA